MAARFSHGYNPNGVLAYFVSFRCYGTWLHGDARSSTDRDTHHSYGAPPIAPDPAREGRERALLRHAVMRLDDNMRVVVDQAVRDVCRHRLWHLYAANVQRDHVHTVVAAPGIKPESVMSAFKAWAARRMREAGLMDGRSRVWSRHGSTIWLWTDKQLGNAIRYTLYGQGTPPSEYREATDKAVQEEDSGTSCDMR